MAEWYTSPMDPTGDLVPMVRITHAFSVVKTLMFHGFGGPKGG